MSITLRQLAVISHSLRRTLIACHTEHRINLAIYGSLKYCTLHLAQKLMALVLRRRRHGVYALAAIYALYKAGPVAIQLARSLRRLVDVADDATAALQAAAREVRQQLEPGEHERPPPRVLRNLMACLASPDALRIITAIVRAALPTAPTANGPAVAGISLDGVLRALDTPHGQRVTANVVAAATAAVVTTPAAETKEGAEQTHPVDKLLDAALSERGRALVLDALGVVVRSAVPVLLAAGAAKARGTPSPHVRTPTSATPISDSPSPSSSMEHLLARALRDRALVRDVVRVAATEAVKAYLTTNARLRFAPATPSPRRPSSQRRIPSTLTPPTPRRINPEPALWRTIGQAAANATRRWLLRAADQNPQPSWIVF